MSEIVNGEARRVANEAHSGMAVLNQRMNDCQARSEDRYRGILSRCDLIESGVRELRSDMVALDKGIQEREQRRGDAQLTWRTKLQIAALQFAGMVLVAAIALLGKWLFG